MLKYYKWIPVSAGILLLENTCSESLFGIVYFKIISELKLRQWLLQF